MYLRHVNCGSFQSAFVRESFTFDILKDFIRWMLAGEEMREVAMRNVIDPGRITRCAVKRDREKLCFVCAKSSQRLALALKQFEMQLPRLLRAEARAAAKA